MGEWLDHLWEIHPQKYQGRHKRHRLELSGSKTWRVCHDGEVNRSQRYETTFVKTKAQGAEKQVPVETCWRVRGVKREKCDFGYLKGGWKRDNRRLGEKT